MKDTSSGPTDQATTSPRRKRGRRTERDSVLGIRRSSQPATQPPGDWWCFQSLEKFEEERRAFKIELDSVNCAHTSINNILSHCTLNLEKFNRNLLLAEYELCECRRGDHAMKLEKMSTFDHGRHKLEKYAKINGIVDVQVELIAGPDYDSDEDTFSYEGKEEEESPDNETAVNNVVGGNSADTATANTNTATTTAVATADRKGGTAGQEKGGTAGQEKGGTAGREKGGSAGRENKDLSPGVASEKTKSSRPSTFPSTKTTPERTASGSESSFTYSWSTSSSSGKVPAVVKEPTATMISREQREDIQARNASLGRDDSVEFSLVDPDRDIFSQSIGSSADTIEQIEIVLGEDQGSSEDIQGGSSEGVVIGLEQHDTAGELPGLGELPKKNADSLDSSITATTTLVNDLRGVSVDRGITEGGDPEYLECEDDQDNDETAAAGPAFRQTTDKGTSATVVIVTGVEDGAGTLRLHKDEYSEYGEGSLSPEREGTLRVEDSEEERRKKKKRNLKSKVSRGILTKLCACWHN